jgi:hypothetical protein
MQSIKFCGKGGRALNKDVVLYQEISQGKQGNNYRFITQTYRLINASFLIGFKLPTLGKPISTTMKRTCLQINTNNNEQTTCEFHRVKMWIKEVKYNHQLISNFKNLYR